MAKKKSTIKKVVETVESWVGMGPKATKKDALKKNTTKTVKPNTKPKTKTAPPAAMKKGNKVVKKRK